jgi:hypothetical protein
MSAQPSARLSGDEILALKFAARRQLARWADRPSLGAQQRARRDALKRAVHVLQNRAFTHGCELRASSPEGGR